MKTLRVIGILATSMVLSLPARAQHEPQGERRGQGNRIERPARPQTPFHESRGRDMGRTPRPMMGARPAPREAMRMQERERSERPDRPSRDWDPPARQSHGREGRERDDRRDDREGRAENRRPREDAIRTRESGRGDYPAQTRGRDQARAWQSQRGWQRDGGWQPHNSWREHRVDNWMSVHRTWAQRGGYGGYYIPRERFYAYCGPDHYFSFQPTIYMGYPRFWYGDYWFMIVDPWPGDWDEDWYASGDCYIDFVDGGYYLYNRRHPGFALAVSVML